MLFLVFAAYLFYTEIAERLIFIFFPMYLVEKNFSPLEIGGIFSLASFIFVISRFFVGKVSDFIGRKNIASTGLLLSSAAVFSYTLASSVFHFIFAKSLKELGNTLTKSVYDSMQADSFPRKVRKKYIRRLGTVFPFSRAIGALIGFLISLYFSFYTGFYIVSLLYFLSFLVIHIFYSERKNIKLHEIKETLKFGFRNYSKEFLLASLTAFLGSFCFTFIYYPAFFLLLEHLGITTSEIFVILLFVYIFSSILIHFIRDIIEKSDEIKIIILGFLFMGIGSLGYSLSLNKVMFIIFIFILGTSYYIWRIGFKVFLYNTTSSRIRGEQLGCVKMLEGVASILGPLFSGILAEFFSFKIVFLFAALIYIFWSVLLKIFKI